MLVILYITIGDDDEFENVKDNDDCSTSILGYSVSKFERTLNRFCFVFVFMFVLGVGC